MPCELYTSNIGTNTEISPRGGLLNIPEKLLMVYKKQGYHTAGRTGLVKPCHWLKKSLKSRGREFCYKQKFYGVPSHRCLQVSLYPGCSQRCLYCWRVQRQDIGITWNELQVDTSLLDDPETLLRAMIAEHRRILSGYKGHPEVDLRMWEEAMNPKHVAISLIGDGVMYPRLGELIEEYHKRGFTTFLVTRGVRPDVLAKIPEPTQLYVSIEAPNKELYLKMNRPIVPRGWELIQKTLEMLPSFSSPTVLRITVIKGLNMSDKLIPEFKRIIEKAQPTYVEVKAYMHVGYSTRRLPRSAMPSHREVVEYSKKLAEATGYNMLMDVEDSRVVLLSRLEKPIKVGPGCQS